MYVPRHDLSLTTRVLIKPVSHGFVTRSTRPVSLPLEIRTGWLIWKRNAFTQWWLAWRAEVVCVCWVGRGVNLTWTKQWLPAQFMSQPVNTCHVCPVRSHKWRVPSGWFTWIIVKWQAGVLSLTWNPGPEQKTSHTYNYCREFKEWHQGKSFEAVGRG